MGIETVLIVVGVIAVIAIVVAAKRSKQKVERHTQPPGNPDPRL